MLCVCPCNYIICRAPVLLFHVMYLGMYAMSGVIYVFISSAFSLFSAPTLLMANEIFILFLHFKGAG